MESSQDHMNLADALSTQVADVLKSVEKRNEDAKKKVRLETYILVHMMLSLWLASEMFPEAPHRQRPRLCRSHKSVYSIASAIPITE
jgi:site-specific recombinase